MKLLVGLVWLLSWLPFRAISALGWAVGSLIAALPSSRRRIGEVNLRLVLPDWTPAARRRLLRQHFVAMVQMLLEYGYCWFASRERIQRLVRIEGLEHLRALEGRNVILMMPHFTGLDLAGQRISLETPLVSMYSVQKDPWLDEFFRTKRLRFGNGIIFSRQQGTRPTLRALKEGRRLYYLPDQDFGHRDSVFAPFFGVPAATIGGLSRMAAVGNAVVLPCYPRRETDGYTVVIEPPLDNFPTDDVVADATRMNAVIEAQARRQLHQYFWLHKRFKSRPPGEADFYAK
ncbi:lipid A biosynthesis acyltransferase [Roseateles asaccharophilus]|uniref:KDO2-lipid IV(A) lauroyltransferase n=1 Tax=Roseateles asaccharophilus TaxID=582607 RepID=A0ABU2ACL9_9BURK|nr:lipid A biosynthesis acyltransferase [Roseateles asaccharophilus]MDR7334348.1 KDO2-lipid IV(A) lauroyltransferase [Roseateles asaccharophilus]